MRVNITLLKEDEEIITTIRNRMGVSVTVTALLRAGLRSYQKDLERGFAAESTKADTREQNVGRSVLSPMAQVRVRRYSDAQIEAMIVELGKNQFTFCPIHSSGYLTTCGCLNDGAEELWKYYRNRYL